MHGAFPGRNWRPLKTKPSRVRPLRKHSRVCAALSGRHRAGVSLRQWNRNGARVPRRGAGFRNQGVATPAEAGFITLRSIAEGPLGDQGDPVLVKT